MKWSFVIQQKFKAALLLSGILLFLVFLILVSGSNIRGIDKSFSSIYEDRLIPAIDIIYLTEDLYSKRIIIEKFLYSSDNESVTSVKDQLAKHNARIDSLISAFELTYLVDKESESLADFKKQIGEYKEIEKRVLNHAQEVGKDFYQNQGLPVFLGAKESLIQLTHIQSEIGRQLFREAHAEVGQFTVISALLVIIALVLGSIVIGLIRSSQIVNTKRDSDFNMN